MSTYVILFCYHCVEADDTRRKNVFLHGYHVAHIRTILRCSRRRFFTFMVKGDFNAHITASVHIHRYKKWHCSYVRSFLSS